MVNQTTVPVDEKADEKAKELNKKVEFASIQDIRGFHATLARVAKVLNTSTTIPSLTMVRIVANKDKDLLMLHATDLEATIVCRVHAVEVLGNIDICVPAKTFVETVGTLRGESAKLVLLGTKAGKFHLVCDKFKANISGLPGEDYPTIPAFSKDSGFEVETAYFKQIAQLCGIALSDDEGRPILNSYYMHEDGEKKLGVATADGFRLSALSLPVDLPIKVTVPEKFMALLATETARAIKIIVTDKGTVVAWTDDNIYLTGQIDGTYPDYKQIIPTKTKLTFVCKTSDLATALKRVSIFDKTIARFVLNGKHGNLKVTGADSEAGSTDTVIPVDIRVPNEELMNTEHEFSFALNAQYFAQFVGCVTTTNLSVSSNSATSAFVCKPDGGSVEFTHVIMPLQLN